MTEVNLLSRLSICRSMASRAILEDHWFSWFLDIHNGGFHKGYTFLSMTYDFPTLENFIRHESGLDANPVNLYCLVATAAALNKPPESRKVLKIFDENGIDKLLDPSDLEVLKKAGGKRGALVGELKDKPGNPKPSGNNQYTKEREMEDRGNSRYNENYLNSDSSVGRSETVEYLTTRIARDRPDIFKRLENGEYRSVRAAAIEAGIVKPKKTKTIREDEPVGKVFEKLRALLTPESLTELAQLITEETTND